MRDYIRRRVWWCAAFAVGGWLMFPLGAAIEQSLPDGVARAAVWIVGFVMFGGAILAAKVREVPEMQGATRADNCHAGRLQLGIRSQGQLLPVLRRESR